MAKNYTVEFFFSKNGQKSNFKNFIPHFFLVRKNQQAFVKYQIILKR